MLARTRAVVSGARSGSSDDGGPSWSTSSSSTAIVVPLRTGGRSRGVRASRPSPASTGLAQSGPCPRGVPGLLADVEARSARCGAVQSHDFQLCKAFGGCSCRDVMGHLPPGQCQLRATSTASATGRLLYRPRCRRNRFLGGRLGRSAGSGHRASFRVVTRLRQSGPAVVLVVTRAHLVDGAAG